MNDERKKNTLFWPFEVRLCQDVGCFVHGTKEYLCPTLTPSASHHNPVLYQIRVPSFFLYA